MQHYFSKNPDVESNQKTAQYAVGNNLLTLKTDAGVFSRLGIDFGTRLLIENTEVFSGEKVLDLGCGNGVIGIALAKKAKIDLTMVDINQRALGLARENCVINNVEANIIESSSVMALEDSDNFDLVVTNPPIRAGKETVFSFYEGAQRHLNDNGRLVVVIQKKQGAESTVKKLKTLFLKVEVITKDKGYWIISGQKPLLSQ